MNTIPFDALMTPYTKLFRANMDLFSRFTISPALMSEAFATLQQVQSRSQDATANIAQSSAYGDFLAGLLRNTLEFWADMGRAAGQLLLQAQGTAARRAQDSAAEAMQTVSNFAQGKGARGKAA